MADPEYDPVARKERYERTKQLKGREPGRGEDESASRAPAPKAPTQDRQAARAAAAQRVKSLNAKLTKLREALRAAREKSASKPSAAEQKSKDKAYNEEYYTKNKTKIANDRKSEARATASKGGSSGSSSSETSKPASRGVEEIEAAIRSTLVELKAAVAKLKTL